MIIQYSEVRKIDNSTLTKYINWRPDMINAEAGQHHYKLLSYLSMKISNGLIFEFGTHYGISSLALSVNKSNKIITYDLPNQYRKYGICPQPKNVELKIGNIFDLNEEYKILNADLIFVDVDHLGVFEWKIYAFLRDNKYKGLLLLDDIVFNKKMKTIWKNITHTKYDVSEIGHAYIDPNGNPGGSALIDFNNSIIINR